MSRQYACILLIAAILVGCSKDNAKFVGNPAPDFSAISLTGQELRLGDLKGRPIILYFFASW